MRLKKMLRRFSIQGACWVGVMSVLTSGMTVLGQEAAQRANRLQEPLYRVSKANVDEAANVNRHPLDPAITLAKDGLKSMRENLKDYTCVMVKRERLGNKLGEYEYMFAKIRNEQRVNDQVVVPFSVYLYFLKPAAIRGREVIYVRGQNEGKLLAHERRDSVLGKFGSVWLNPTGPMAMRGNRYPITEIGLETLITRLLEKGIRDRARGECEVEFRKGAKINGRTCTMLQVKHPLPRPYFDFHIAQIFIDDEYNVPLRYAAYTWSERPGGEPVLLEEYTFLKLKLNVGFTDKDFDSKNKDYSF